MLYLLYLLLYLKLLSVLFHYFILCLLNIIIYNYINYIKFNKHFCNNDLMILDLNYHFVLKNIKANFYDDEIATIEHAHELTFIDCRHVSYICDLLVFSRIDFTKQK